VGKFGGKFGHALFAEACTTTVVSKVTCVVAETDVHDWLNSETPGYLGTNTVKDMLVHSCVV